MPDKDKLLLGFETSDDAAVWEINKTTAAVLTVDFFTPVVDDPYEFGRVAAANALSDVFAMGARPHVALNLLALDSELGAEVAGEILRGGADAAHAAGAFVAGGHTIDDEEPKYGLCVFGTVDPSKIVRNGGAIAGDVLYLTKRIGTGIMSAAVKNELVTQQEFRPAVESMMELNIAGGEAMVAAGVHAATDVTGFGLAGHLHEMLAPRDFGGEMVGKVTQALTTWEELPLRLEAGTPNYVGAVALAAACDYIDSLGRENVAAYEDDLVAHAMEKLRSVEGLRIAGSPSKRAGLVSFMMDDVHPLDLCTLVDARGVALRSGHNCAQPALAWLGETSVARLSPAFYNTFEEIDYAVGQIERAAQMLRAARSRK